MDKVDETLFLWNVSMPLFDKDFSTCKLIFTFRYYPSNNNWNPFKDPLHPFSPFITIEWGIHIKYNSICPLAVRPLHISEVLTSEVEDDLINYTCSAACGNDAKICKNAHHARFHPYLSPGYQGFVKLPTDVLFAVNDLSAADSCTFITYFNYSSKFCDESWADVETVQIPTEIQQVYPQFIKVPELYRNDNEKVARVPRYFCDQLWNSTALFHCVVDLNKVKCFDGINISIFEKQTVKN